MSVTEQHYLSVFICQQLTSVRVADSHTAECMSAIDYYSPCHALNTNTYLLTYLPTYDDDDDDDVHRLLQSIDYYSPCHALSTTLTYLLTYLLTMMTTTTMFRMLVVVFVGKSSSADSCNVYGRSSLAVVAGVYDGE